MQTVIAAFQDRAQAERARDELLQRGFDRSDVHIEQQDVATTRASADTRGTAPSSEESGGITGFFGALFGSQDAYEREGSTWSEAVRRGSSVVVIDAQNDTQAREAASCLESLGAQDIDAQASQWRSQGWTGGAPSSDAAGTVQRSRDDSPPAGKQGVLDVVQEELQVGKRQVDQGGVRVIQRVSAKPVREVVRLRQERAVVERRPVNRPADVQDLGAFKEGTLEVRESAEEVVASKSARVVEEVRVGKEVSEREAVVEDKLRRKDVEVERIEGSERERAMAAARGARPDPDAPARSPEKGKLSRP